MHQRGIEIKSYKQIASTVLQLMKYSKIDSVHTIHTNTVSDFLYHQKETRNWTAKTFRNNRQNLHSFFAWTTKQGYTKKNVVSPIEKPKLKKRVPRSLSESQIIKVLGAIHIIKWKYRLERYRNEAIIHAFLYTGLRLNELLSLKMDDVKFEDRELLVREGKGKKEREVPLHRKLIPILKTYLDLRNELLPTSEWFFTGIRSNKRLYPSDIHWVCKRLSIASRVKMTPHMLRHTFATQCISKEMSVYKVMAILGHANISTTEIYLSSSLENIKHTYDQIDLF